MCYHRRVRACLLAVLLLCGADSTWAADPLAEARRLYNLGQYATAEKVAREATAVPATADAARVVLGRIRLERYRQSNDFEDLTAARASFSSRARLSGSALRSGGRNLSATGRPRRTSSARYTSPMPPAPRRWPMR